MYLLHHKNNELGLRDDVQTLEAELKRVANAISADPAVQEQFDLARDVVRRCEDAARQAA